MSDRRRRKGAAPLDVAVEAALRAEGLKRVKVVATNNRVRLVSSRKRDGVVEVRVARRLEALGDRAVKSVVRFVVGRRGARDELRTLFAELPPPPPPRQRRIVLRPAGTTYDLLEIAEEEAAGALEVPSITWGPRRRRRRRQRTVRLGSYNADVPIIRVNPILDDPRVPRWYVGFVVFHELLHHDLGIDEVEGRRVIHPPEFRERERRHPRYDEAQVWEKKLLPRLLSGRL